MIRDHSTEIWLTLPRFPNHEFSSHGRIRNRKNGHILRPILNRYGYPTVSIGSVDNLSVRRLIAEAFLGIPDDERTQVNHIDGDRTNNHIFNLEWVTPRENIRWAAYKGTLNTENGLRRAREVNLKPVRIVELDQTFESILACSKFLGVESTNVSRVLTGARKGQRLCGYHIEYA